MSRRNKLASAFFSCTTFGALALIGAVCGVIFSFTYGQGWLSRWQPLGQPPFPVTVFVREAMRNDVAVVETEGGGLFSCHPSKQDNCWVAVEGIPEGLDTFPHVCDIPSGLYRPPPPGRVKDNVMMNFCAGEIATYAEYVLLDDGNVWQWVHGTSSYDILIGFVIIPLIGAVAGFALGAIVLFMTWLLRRRQQLRVSAS